MRIGDLVRCTFQPSVSCVKSDCAMPMEYHIQGEIGIITNVRWGHVELFRVLFPQFGYTHTISRCGIEIISEK